MSNTPAILDALADLFTTYAVEAAELRDGAAPGESRAALAAKEDTWRLASREALKVSRVAAERGW